MEIREQLRQPSATRGKRGERGESRDRTSPDMKDTALVRVKQTFHEEFPLRESPKGSKLVSNIF
jgi:hypothetical protein